MNAPCSPQPDPFALASQAWGDQMNRKRRFSKAAMKVAHYFPRFFNYLHFAETGALMAWPAIATLVMLTGLSVRAVQYALAELVEAGVLEIQRTAGRGRSNLFIGLFTEAVPKPAAEKVQTICTISRPGRGPGKVQNPARKGANCLHPTLRKEKRKKEYICGPAAAPPAPAAQETPTPEAEAPVKAPEPEATGQLDDPKGQPEVDEAVAALLEIPLRPGYWPDPQKIRKLVIASGERAEVITGAARAEAVFWQAKIKDESQQIFIPYLETWFREKRWKNPPAPYVAKGAKPAGKSRVVESQTIFVDEDDPDYAAFADRYQARDRRGRRPLVRPGRIDGRLTRGSDFPKEWLAAPAPAKGSMTEWLAAETRKDAEALGYDTAGTDDAEIALRIIEESGARSAAMAADARARGVWR